MKKIYLLLLIPGLFQAQLPNTLAKYLDKNRVKARVNTVNNKFYNIFGNNMPSYEVPKGKATHAQFANCIWIGGFDDLGQLHMTANTYRQAGVDVWPGPLDTNNIAAFTTSNTNVYNKLWKVDCDEINAFVTAFSNGSVANSSYTVPPDILAYPAQGIANFQKKMQAFYDANGNGIYSPTNDGDYPIIKGQQQILSIYNDNYATHTEADAPAMGLEIHEKSYCYYDPNLPDSMKAVNYSTFYNYTIYNRSNLRYSNVFLSDWSDVDLGYYLDDYVGTDTLNNFTYCYNSDGFDETAFGLNGYGNMPPVISHAILQTPYCTSDGIDNDGNGFIDEPGEQFLMNRSSYYLNNTGSVNPLMTNPDSAIHYYRYMAAKWKNGAPFTVGGNGFGGTVPTHYVFPGNPVNNTGWTAASGSNTPTDSRIIYSSGPFTFPAKSKIEWGYVIVYSQDTSQAVNTISQFNTRVQRDVKNVRYYDQMHQYPQCLPPLTVGINEYNTLKLHAKLFPNPAWNTINIQFTENLKTANITLLDVSGRILRSQVMQNTNDTTIAIDALESGIYFVKIDTEQTTMTLKFVKSL